MTLLASVIQKSDIGDDQKSTMTEFSSILYLNAFHVNKNKAKLNK